VLDALDACTEASRAGLVRETGQPNQFVFTHALVRDTLRDELGPSRRVHLHGQVAAAIEAVHADDLDAWLPDLAMHHAEAAYPGNVAPAVEFALRAAEQARLGAATWQAVAILERALSVARMDAPRDPDGVLSLLVALAETTAVDTPPVARPYADEACRIAIEAGHWAWLGRACASMWSTATTSSAGGVAGDRWLLDLCELALKHPGDLDPAVRARVMAMTVQLHMWAGTDPPPERAAQAIALASQADDEVGIYGAASTKLISRLQQGLSRREVDDLLQALQRVTTRDRHLHFMSATVRCTGAALLGDAARFAAASSEVDDAARILGSPRAGGWSGWWRAMSAIRVGEWEKAKAATREGSDATRFDELSAVMLGANSILIAAHQGQAERVRSALPGEATLAGLSAATLGFAAFVLALAGDGEASADALTRIVDERMFDHDATGLLVLGTAAWAASAVREPTLSRPVEDELVRFRGLMAYGGIMEWGSVDGLLGRLAFNDDRLDEADELFASGLALEDGFGALVLAAYTRVWWARCLLARGEPGDAERAATLLGEATATADRLGMAHIAAEAGALGNVPPL
jgi:hypothetical protein